MNQIKTTLYALNKDRTFSQWEVFTDGPNVIVEFGKMGGKIQTKLTQCEPKNVGRANETTAEEQALAEAQSKWEKQVRLGYRESTAELETEDNFSPMLAQDAIKRSKDIVYPCYAQPKLDGLRCLVTFDDQGEPVFNSRGNKTYPIEGKIVEQIKELRKVTGFDMFDGEVYLHGLSLQKIVSLAKKWRSHEDIETEINKEYLAEVKKWKRDPLNYEAPELKINKYGGFCSDDLEFHIFDIPSKGKVWDSDSGYETSWDYNEHPCRYADLMNTDSLVSMLQLNKIKVVHGSFMEDEEQTKAAIGIYMQRGYEGAIIRNFKGVYEFGQRSTDLQKWKIFQDSEAKVIDIQEDKNGEGVLVCKDQYGIVVKMKMKGTHQDRLYVEQVKLKGKFVNFTFQAKTDDGNYQFPVAVRVREVDEKTWEVQE